LTATCGVVRASMLLVVIRKRAPVRT